MCAQETNGIGSGIWNEKDGVKHCGLRDWKRGLLRIQKPSDGFLQNPVLRQLNFRRRHSYEYQKIFSENSRIIFGCQVKAVQQFEFSET